MDIETELKEILPAGRIRTRYIDLLSFASDAGFYQLVPRAVVQTIDEKEIIALFRFSRLHQIPLVFRTGGTSLSGQSITDGILVDLSQHWKKIMVEESGQTVRVQPGITGAMVNAHLLRHSKKIGPDPSSISAAMMGGILSNNASGMCCGVRLNSYHTTKYIRFILPDGNIFTTENKNDYARFEKECEVICRELAGLRQKIMEDETLHHAVRKKYETKNTVGYSLNALVDYTHPLDILAHLLIGAEGTLAFISEAVMETVPEYSFKSTALLFFSTMQAACDAIGALMLSGALMVELMDRASLSAVEKMEGIPALVATLPAKAAALLIEFQENDRNILEQKVNDFLSIASSLELFRFPVFTSDPQEQALLWKVRKGLFPAVGAVRARGTTVILEDLAFPVDRLGNAIADLQQLFKKHGYLNAIIFGHAKDGNIHFVITQAFDNPSEIERYDLFIRDVVDLVVHRYDGTLKAEHGTGRNMAPFVETQWGTELYGIMKKIKQLIDPENLLNPGVIINADKSIHLKNLKDLPAVEEEVDKCIECGYCEPVCPSRDLTSTPRRRIVLRRALKKLELAGDTVHYKQLLDQFEYEAIDTCAVDGLCATACPVDINTGDLIKRLRRENHSRRANRYALWVARHFKKIERFARLALQFGTGLNRIFGKKTMTRITGLLQKIIPAMPRWTAQMAAPPDLTLLREINIHPASIERKKIVYFPACITRTLGTYEGKKKNMVETFLSICEKSSIDVTILKDIQGSCCSQIFSSKGFQDAYRFTANKIADKMYDSSEKGKYPIVMDVSSCTYSLHHIGNVLDGERKIKFDQLTILDSIDFLNNMVVPGMKINLRVKNIVLHPVCSLDKMKTKNSFIRLAKQFAETVTVPISSGCCGMAGDRGFLFPELVDSATRAESKEVNEQVSNGYYSSTKTCEMAMSAATDKNYLSILYLVDESIE